MTLKIIQTACVLALFAMFSSAGRAETAATADATEKAESGKASAGKKTAPHSHLEEKTGIPQKKQESGAPDQTARPSTVKDQSRHFHPRDGK